MSQAEDVSYGYEFQINYDDTKKPIFRSDRYQFTVVMSNLNYDVPQNVPRMSLRMSPRIIWRIRLLA